MARARKCLAISALALLALAGPVGCGGGSGGSAPTPSPSPTPAPSPTPTPAAFRYDVSRCIEQAWPSTGLTVFNSVVPDTVKIDFSRPNGFPNGRYFTDPVVDITLSVIFLDLTREPANAFARIPLDPGSNDPNATAGLNDGTDVLPRSTFPYYGPPQGSHVLSGTAGTNFNFRTDPASAYTRVDRMGMPAVATALIPSASKVPYNDANPSDDANNVFTGVIREDLEELMDKFYDDITALRLTPCGTPR